MVRAGAPSGAEVGGTLRVRDIPTRRRRTVLVRRRRRFECDGCGRTHIETHPQVTGKFTAEYAGELARASGRLSVMAVSEASEVGWGTIQREGEARRRRALPCRPSGGKVPPAPGGRGLNPARKPGRGRLSSAR